MKKDNVLLYDGGLIDYELWNAPVIIDLKGLYISQNGVKLTDEDGDRDGYAIPHIRKSILADALLADIRMGDVQTSTTFACDIRVQKGEYIQPHTQVTVNNATLTTNSKGAWLITKSMLMAVTVTHKEKPLWRIDHAINGELTINPQEKQPMAEKQETLEANFTNDELQNFAEGKINLTIPLVYEDEDKIQHNAGEVTLTHVKYGETNHEGIIAETFCWPHQLHDVGTQEVVFALQVYTQDMDLLSFEFACDRFPSRHVGFLPFGLDCIVPVNVTISRKTNGEKHDNTSSEPLNASQKKIAETCDAIKNLLLEKNRKYGDSALNPVRVFSKADTVEQIKVRMDDKLSRIRNEQGDEDEDVYMDLAGYLVLMLIAKEEQKKTKGETDK